MRISVASTAFLLLFAIPQARAASKDFDPLDPIVIAQMESRADHAGPREQCFLYTELVQVYTEVAGRELAAGDTEQAHTTLQRIQHYTVLIHAALARDTKRVKDAEKIVHMATYRLGQYMHHASSEDEMAFSTTLKQLDKVHEELLAQVFAH
jgi:hypothetical protein